MGQYRKAVYIEWVDAEGSDEWTDNIDTKNPPIHTIGWLAKKTKKNVIISHSYDRKNEKWGGYMKIPVTAIRKILELPDILTECP